MDEITQEQNSSSVASEAASSGDPAELVRFIAASLVDHSDAVKVTTEANDQTIVVHLDVHPDDLGQVIGKSGRIARSLRMLLGSSDLAKGVRRPFYELDILNAQHDRPPYGERR